MSRVFHIALAAFLVLNLLGSAAFAGYARTAHGLAMAGAVTLVICASGEEAQSVTLDRKGAPIDPAGQTCSHCDMCLPLAATKPREAALAARDVPVRCLGAAAQKQIFVKQDRLRPAGRGPPSGTRS